jgi:hypothetical protein
LRGARGERAARSDQGGQTDRDFHCRFLH